MKRKMIVSALAAVISALPLSAGASQRLCQNLESRLQAAAAAPSPGTRGQLDQALRRAHRDGCDGYTLSRGSACRNHVVRIQRLQARLAETGSGASASDRGRRARLLSALRANGCRSSDGRKNDRRGMIVRVEPRDEPLRDMSGNIPVPTVRPMSPAEEYRAEYASYGRSLQHAADLREWERLKKPRPIPPERLGVRIVGTEYLPGDNEDMEFDRIAKRETDPLNDVLVSVLSWIDQGIVSTAVAEESGQEPEDDLVRTASAE